MIKLDEKNPNLYEDIFDQVYSNTDLHLGTGKYDLNKARMLVTKKAQGLTLAKWMSGDSLPTEQTALISFVEDILLQIAYTLIVFEDFGFVHHDLHAGNIFVEELSTPLHLSLNIGGPTAIVRNIKYFVQIYDFDHSAKRPTRYSPTTIRNTYLDTSMCREFGECNKFYKNMDWFTILHSLYMLKGETLPIPYKEIVKRNELLDYKYGPHDLVYTGRPCYCDNRNENCTKCTRIQLDDTIIMSPEEYLFENFDFCPCEAAYSRPAHRDE
jgi:hypothetical protein